MRPFAGMRTRVLLSFLVLLIVSTAASVIVLREVLISRIDDEVSETLADDIDELQDLSEGRVDPATGEPFEGQVGSIFDAYLASHSPIADSATVSFVEDERYASQSADPDLEPLVTALDEVGPVDEPTQGTIETPLGPARFTAVPVSTGTQTGSLTTGQLLVERREQVDSAVRIAVGVSIVVMLLASLFIWLAAGRAMAPLQALARTARQISETDLSQRIPVTRERRDRSARPHAERDARPPRDGVRRPARVPGRREPRAANADHGDPRPHRDAGRGPA